MPSASRAPVRLAVAACAGLLLLGAGAGCSTTQEKAALHREEAKRALEARAERRAQKKKGKGNGGKGDEPRENGGQQR